MDICTARASEEDDGRLVRSLTMFAGKEVRILLKGQAQEAYLTLKRKTDKEARSILNSFERIKNILKDNPQYGDPVAKNLIPEELKKLGYH